MGNRLAARSMYLFQLRSSFAKVGMTHCKGFVEALRRPVRGRVIVRIPGLGRLAGDDFFAWFTASNGA